MVKEKLEGLLREEAEQSFKEEVLKLHRQIQESDFGKNIGFEPNKHKKGLGLKWNSDLKEEYIDKYIEEKMKELLNLLEEDTNTQEELEKEELDSWKELLKEIEDGSFGSIKTMDKEEVDKVLGLMGDKVKSFLGDTKEEFLKAKEQVEGSMEEYVEKHKVDEEQKRQNPSKIWAEQVVNDIKEYVKKQEGVSENKDKSRMKDGLFGRNSVEMYVELKGLGLEGMNLVQKINIYGEEGKTLVGIVTDTQTLQETISKGVFESKGRSIEIEWYGKSNVREVLEGKGLELFKQMIDTRKLKEGKKTKVIL